MEPKVRLLMVSSLLFLSS